ncbi:hypothetical protein DL96DRAFT_1626046 [Flagelloscypha sp. PMI_526]|nr:hypothetical protein DL96DRAFT_1626046 [Flagelloscypha sp. PMI_526]
MTWDKLPLELVLIVVHFAACLDGSTAVALTMVSNKIQAIADRALFDDFYFREYRREQTHRLLKMMFSSSCSLRLLRARGYITLFRTHAREVINVDLLKVVLNHCPNLRTFVTNRIHDSYFSIPAPSSLDTIGIIGDFELYFGPVDQSWNYRFVRGITRVIVENPGAGMSRFQGSSLTHIFLSLRPAHAPPWTVHPLPVNLQLCLVYMWFETEISDRWLHELISDSALADIQHQGRVDKRFVLVVPHSNAQWPGRKTRGEHLVAPDWGIHRSMSEGSRAIFYKWVNEDAWAKGEKIVQQRV